MCDFYHFQKKMIAVPKTFVPETVNAVAYVVNQDVNVNQATPENNVTWVGFMTCKCTCIDTIT